MYWRNVSDGGKTQLPLNQPCYVITSPIEGPDGSQAAWSVVLEVTENHQSRDSRIGTGTARFAAFHQSGSGAEQLALVGLELSGGFLDRGKRRGRRRDGILVRRLSATAGALALKRNSPGKCRGCFVTPDQYQKMLIGYSTNTRTSLPSSL